MYADAVSIFMLFLLMLLQPGTAAWLCAIAVAAVALARFVSVPESAGTAYSNVGLFTCRERRCCHCAVDTVVMTHVQ